MTARRTISLWETAWPAVLVLSLGTLAIYAAAYTPSIEARELPRLGLGVSSPQVTEILGTEISLVPGPAAPLEPSPWSDQNGQIVHSAAVTFSEETLTELEARIPNIRETLEGVELRSITYLSGGLKIAGYLAVPKASGPHPSVIWNRGGNRDFGALDDRRAALILAPIASWGYVVVASQYRGGPGSEGEDEFGGRDVQDVLSLIPLLDALPEADAHRIAMYGWSRGALMTCLALTHTDRITAAILGAGTYDAHRTIADRPEMEEHVYSVLAPEYATRRTQALDARSPARWVHRLPKTTPLLLLHGTADERVNPHEALTLSTALLATNHPFRLMLFENGTHGLREHRAEVDGQVRKWLEQHLSQKNQ